jgi:hypothetical protein
MIDWNKCYYIDCLDSQIGLPYLADLIESGDMEKIDLGLFDGPWGVGVGKKLQQGRTFHGRKLSVKPNKKYYEDPFDNDWNIEWFGYAQRVCKNIINLISSKIEIKTWWFRNTDPSGEIIITHPNGHSQSKVASNHKFSTYLCYGKFENKLITDTWDYTVPWGFLSKEKQIKHPTPKGTEIPLRLFMELRPKTILDCFAGSSSYLYAAHLLGIKWIGYEIDREYKHDKTYRFSQKTLGKYKFLLDNVLKSEETRIKTKKFKRKQEKQHPQISILFYQEKSTGVETS